jgi:hypothetical protein
MSKTYISVALRREVQERAGQCCEYCRIHEEDNFLPFEVDHIIAEKHHGETESSNLCWSCSTCNGYKGSDVASYDRETKQLTPLFNPRLQNWIDHFQLEEDRIVGLTPIGRVTISILKLNASQRIDDRAALIRLDRYPCTS